MPPAFRLKSKTIFFTYSQADAIDHDELYQFFLDLQPVYLRVGRELHEDGHAHYHVLVNTSKPVETTNARKFDRNGIHPNIESNVRNPNATWEYCGKDGNSKDFGDPPPPRKMTKNEQMLKAIKADNKEDFLEAMKHADASRYIYQHDQLITFANKRFKKEIDEYKSAEGLQFNLQDDMVTWLAQRNEVSAMQPPPPRKRAARPGGQGGQLPL